MKKVFNISLFLLLFGLFSSPWTTLLAQDDLDDSVIESLLEEIKREDNFELKEEQYPEATPWEGKPDDTYINENIQRQSGGQKAWKKNSSKLKYATKIRKQKKDKKKPNKFTGEGLGEIFKWVLIVLGIIVIIGLIVYLVKDGSFRQGKKITVDISEEKLNWIEENLPEADVASPLEAAINASQYRKSIRLYFLLIVQRLSLAGDIKWQKEKTNRAYILETYSKDFYQDFRACVRIYERVWYGEREVTKEEFWKIEPIFKKLATDINPPIDTADEE